jgi:thiol-disulfide isomerase/thioredoxin
VHYLAFGSLSSDEEATEMKTIMATCLVLLILTSVLESASAQSYLGVIEDSPIVEIRGETADTARLGDDRFVEDNLDYLLSTHAWVIVNFSAYWCGDSRAYRPDYDSVAAMAEYSAIRWAYADVDGTVGNESFRKRFQLPGVPTTILFHNGEIIKAADGTQSILDGHKGDKTATDLLAFLKRYYHPKAPY